MSFLDNLFQRKNKELILFPEYENVFGEKYVDYNLTFFPLCSLSLATVMSNRNDWVHFVDVWNNGDIDDDLFGDYRSRHWIRFSLKDSKYVYNGDKTAFPEYGKLREWKKEADLEFEKNKDEYIKLIERSVYNGSKRREHELRRSNIDFDYGLYVQQQISYQVSKLRFKQTGKLIPSSSFSKGYKVKEREAIKKGGDPIWENELEMPATKSGGKWQFIGQLEGYNYFFEGSDTIMLFLDVDADEVLEIIQFG